MRQYIKESVRSYSVLYSLSLSSVIRRYSFDNGPLHVVSIDTETDFLNAPNDSYTLLTTNGGFCDPVAGCGNWVPWLEADLAAVNRSKTPWVIVGGHRPVYSVVDANSDGTPSGTSLALQEAVEDIFLRYGVDFYFSGHEHA